MNGLKMWYSHTPEHTAHTHRQWNIEPQIKENPVICNTITGSQGHYTKWNKSSRERYCMVSHVKYEEVKLTEAEKTGSCQGIEGGRNR